MKKKLIISLLASVFYIGQTLAGNVLTVSNVDVPQGGQATMEIGCEFDTEYTAFELQLSLPEGLSLLTDEDGYPVIEKAFGTNHILTGNLLPSNGNYKITCRSMDNISIPTNGPLFRVTVQADASLSLGTSLSASVTACEFTRTADSNGENLADVDFTVNITEFRVILDEAFTTIPETAINVDVRVKRTINAGMWSTICLPFAMTSTQVTAAFGDDVEIADFAGYETQENGDGDIVGIRVKFNDVDVATGMEANHPYIIKVHERVSEFTVDGVNVEPSDEPIVAAVKRTRRQWSELIGTYEAQTEVPDQTLFLSEGKFWYSTGNTRMKAFRAYFDFYDVLSEMEGAGTRIALSFEDETTGVVLNDNVHLTTGNGVFDLQGRRVFRPARKGLYIERGKKKVIK